MATSNTGQTGRERYTVFIRAKSAKAKSDVLRELILKEYRSELLNPPRGIGE